jgi:hypothetical protein
MHRLPASLAIRSFVVIALVAVAPVRTIGGGAVDIPPVQDRITGSEAVEAPLVVAQGRCFNGRCY